MKVFLDTNVLLSAFGTRGLCADVFRLVQAEHELLTSAQVLDELTRGLQNKFRLDASIVRDVLALMREQATVVVPVTGFALEIRDPDDVAIVAAAVAGQADILVTGDRDLLDLDAPPLPIIDPRAFWTRSVRP